MVPDQTGYEPGRWASDNMIRRVLPDRCELPSEDRRSER